MLWFTDIVSPIESNELKPYFGNQSNCSTLDSQLAEYCLYDKQTTVEFIAKIAYVYVLSVLNKFGHHDPKTFL